MMLYFSAHEERISVAVVKKANTGVVLFIFTLRSYVLIVLIVSLFCVSQHKDKA